MKEYWPIATYGWVAISGKKHVSDLFTTKPFPTLEEAMSQFSVWEIGYSLVDTWIYIREDNKTLEILKVEKVWTITERSKECSTDTE